MKSSKHRWQIRLLELLCLVLLIFPSTVLAVDAPYQSYTRDQFQGATPDQTAYVPDNTWNGIDMGAGVLTDPRDIFVDSQGNLFVADTGNARVVRISTDKMKKTVVYGTQPGPGKLSSPQGVFVDKSGKVYVADASRGAIVVFDLQGHYLCEYHEPHSELLDAARRAGYNYDFKPSKVVVDAQGYLYVTVEGENRGMVKISPTGELFGFFGSTNTNTTWWEVLYHRFMDQGMANRLGFRRPEAFNNMCLGPKGLLFTVNSQSDSNSPPLRRLSPVGKDTMPTGVLFGDSRYALRALSEDSTHSLVTTLVDVAVDQDGIFTVLDESTRRLFQYDPQGHMLSVFGGRIEQGSGYNGEATGIAQAGLTQQAVSIAEDSNRRIYVLDNLSGTVGRYSPTEFGRLIHRAVRLYNEGRYEEAAKPWQQVLERDLNFFLAYNQIAKAYYRSERYQDAMEYYYLGQDQVGYSDAYWQYRQHWLRENFGYIAPLVILLMLIIGLALQRRRLRIRRTFEEERYA